VLPEADLKIYLDASVEERARRRFTEMQTRGELVEMKSQPTSLNDILRAMRKRDEIDSTRQMSPLRPAEDAIVLISDQLDSDQVLERVKEIIETSSVQS
jgi:cytidylate kinase